ncbi:MAG: YwiC-like family protein [Candidatus Mariimomonas ferrooxydans]
MKIPIVKEYGSWAVFILSCSAGIIAGLLTRPWQTGKDFSVEIVLTILGLIFLINSKNPLSSAIKTKQQRQRYLLWFAVFSLCGLVLLIPFLTEGFRIFLIFSPLVLLYIVFLLFEKEHFLLSELTGFSLLTLSAPVVYFVITQEMSLRLYLVVFIFFAAGVFKVRVRIKKTSQYRWCMIIYCAASLFFFSLLNVSAIMLLPLFENVIYALWMRDEKLKTTGNIELIKGVIFIILFGFYWQ